MAEDSGVQGWSADLHADNRKVSGNSSRWLREDEGGSDNLEKVIVSCPTREATVGEDGSGDNGETRGDNLWFTIIAALLLSIMMHY